MDGTLASLIAAADSGDTAAAADLFTRLYSELHGLARRELARVGGARAVLGVSSLLHEAFVAMRGVDGAEFPDRARFMAYAARVMRSLIIDHARRRNAQKRGTQFELTTLEPDRVSDGSTQAVDLQQLEELGKALEELASIDPALAEIVDLKYFCGVSFKEIAAISDVSERTLQRRWDKARLILNHTLKASLA